MVFAHGFGCDQNMWRFVAPAFEADYRVVLFDYVGAGGSDLAAYDPERYALARRLRRRRRRDLPSELDLRDAIFVGHSVSAMIGVLAAERAPERFGKLVLVGPSPRYIDDEGYIGGFTPRGHRGAAGVDGRNYLGWSSAMAPAIMGNADRPGARRGADRELLPHRPGDRRALRPRDVPVRQPRRPAAASRVPTLVLQCSDDVIAPDAVGRVRAPRRSRARGFVQLAATGHCPNLSAPRGDDRRRSGPSSDRTRPSRAPRTSTSTRPAATCPPTPGGRIVRVNATFLRWTGYTREQLVGVKRFQDLLTAGGRIYHETHYAPLLRMQGTVREIAVDIVCADGRRLPVLVNSVLLTDAAGEPRIVRTTVFDATERKRYERELLAARDRERGARQEVELLHETSRTIAHTLQRSLLPATRRTTRASASRRSTSPAVRDLEVGGDWYDAFALPGGKVGIVVGDVVGRGLAAATAMGQLRSAVRALAGAGLGRRPSCATSTRSSSSRRASQYATLAYAEVDPATRRRSCSRPPATCRRCCSATAHRGCSWAAARRRSASPSALPRTEATLHARAGRGLRALHRRAGRAPQRDDRRPASRACSPSRDPGRGAGGARRRAARGGVPARTTSACSSSAGR